MRPSLAQKKCFVTAALQVFNFRKFNRCLFYILREFCATNWS